MIMMMMMMMIMHFVFEIVPFLFRITEVLGSNFDPETGFADGGMQWCLFSSLKRFWDSTQYA
jgi:hypothetical protein